MQRKECPLEFLICLKVRLLCVFADTSNADSEVRVYNVVKSNLDKAHGEGPLSSFYRLIKIIFISTFSTFYSPLCVCRQTFESRGRSKRRSIFLSSRERTQRFQEEGAMTEFKEVQHLRGAKGQVQKG